MIQSLMAVTGGDATVNQCFQKPALYRRTAPTTARSKAVWRRLASLPLASEMCSNLRKPIVRLCFPSRRCGPTLLLDFQMQSSETGVQINALSCCCLSTWRDAGFGAGVFQG